MKNLFLSIALMSSTIVFAQNKITIAVPPSQATVTGNIPRTMMQENIAEVKNKLSFNTQEAIARAMVHQKNRRKNRNLNVQIVTHNQENATFTIPSSTQHTMIMNPNVATAINAASYIVNANTAYRAPYVASSATYVSYKLVDASNNEIVWDGNGNMNAKARKIFRYLRRHKF
jgi:DNA-binding protein H-NS